MRAPCSRQDVGGGAELADRARAPPHRADAAPPGGAGGGVAAHRRVGAGGAAVRGRRAHRRGGGARTAPAHGRVRDGARRVGELSGARTWLS